MDFIIEKCNYCIIIINTKYYYYSFLYILIKVSRDLILAKKQMPLSVYVY